MTGGGLLQQISTLLAVSLVLIGLAFALAERGREYDGRKFVRAVDAWWRDLAATAWRGLPVETASRLLVRLRHRVRVDFVEADRGPVFGIVFLGTTFVLIPAAAVLNLMTGGSPFLAFYYLSNLVALAILNFTGEDLRLALINRIAAFYLGLSVFLVIPAYVLHSFTDRMLNSPISVAVLESLLVVPLLFIVAQSLMLGWESYVRDAGPAVGRLVRTFLAALPAAYVLTFVAWQIGVFLVDGEARIPGTWPLLISAVLFGALALPLSDLIVDWATAGRSFVRFILGCAAMILAAGVLAVLLHQAATLPAANHPAVSESVDLLLGRKSAGLGPGGAAGLWALYLPLLPAAYFAGGLGFAIVGRAMVGPFARWLGDGTVVTKPMLAAGVLCVTIGVVVWIGGRFA